MGTLPCLKRPYLAIQGKAASLTRSNRTGLFASTYPRRHSRPSGQTGGGKGSRCKFSRLLQPPLSCSKEKRLLETRHRSESSKRLPSEAHFQDGDSGLHPEIHQTYALGCVSGPGRCLLSCPHPHQLPEVPTVRISRPGVPVPGHAFWIGHSTSCVHEAHGCGRCTSPSTGCTTPSVFRRLVATPAEPRSTAVQPTIRMERAPIIRAASQREEIGTSSDSRLYVCGNEFSHPDKQSQSLPAENNRPSDAGQMGHISTLPHCPTVPISQRYPELSLRLRSSRPASSPPSTDLPIRPLEVDKRRSVSSDSHSPFPGSTPSVVAQRASVAGGSSPTSSTTIIASHHRCKHGGLGCPPGTTQCDGVGHLVPTGNQAPHQQSGNEGSSPVCPPLPRAPPKRVRFAIDRQHISGVLHTVPRGNTLPISVSRDEGPSGLVQDPQRLNISQTHSGSPQCVGGRFVSQTSASSIGVDTPSGSSESDFPSAGRTNGRSVRNKEQSPPPPVRKPSLRPSGLVSRRAFVRLGPAGSLRLSPADPDPSDLSQDQSEQLPDPPGSPVVAQEIVVQRPPRSPQSPPQESAQQARPPVTERQPTRGPRHVPSTRLTVIRLFSGRNAFLREAAALIASARRQSTRSVYDSRWNIFADWCVRRQIDPLNPSTRRIADFLIHLFDVKKLSLSSIKGYRSMLSQTLAFHKSSKVCSDPAISELIRAMELKRPVTRSLAPKWDLACVLWSLNKAPYEPLAQASLQFLTWKTVFLLAMASAKRRSELHAFSVEDRHLRFDSSDGSVTLLCQPGFLAKTQLPSTAPKPIKIPSLSRTCGENDNDRLLCPVRALKFYLNRVKPSRGRRKRLFLPLKGGGDVSAASISRWVSSTVKKAYSSLSSRELSLFKIRAHEVRALSTSWAFVNHTPLADVLQAAFWRNSTTFSTFYLRSFESQHDNLHMLGPLVVAQTVVTATEHTD